VPRQLATFSNRAFSIYCCDTDEHTYTISQPLDALKNFLQKFLALPYAGLTKELTLP
jgi:hypothetical protein